MMFALAIIPLLDSVVSTIMTAIEVVKGHFSLKVAECNEKLSQIGTSEDEPARVIGFSIPTEEDDYEDEED